MRFAGLPAAVVCGPDLDHRLEEVHTGPAVFAIHAGEGEPYLGRTAVLRRRLKRLLKPRENPSRLLNLRSIARRIEYWPAGSTLESGLVLYELARTYLPRTYETFLKLRMPAYVRLTSGTVWARTHVTTRITGSGRYFGPFRSRGVPEAGW